MVEEASGLGEYDERIGDRGYGPHWECHQAPALPPGGVSVVMKLLATVSAPFARAFGFKPLISPGQLSFLLWNVRVDAGKAQRELGFQPTPLAEGISRTVTFLHQQGLVPRAPEGR